MAITRALLARHANPNAEYHWNWHRELPRTALWGALCAVNHLPLAVKPSVLDAIRKLPRCLVLENVADADPRMYRFLQQVYYVPGACLIVTAGSRDCLGHLRKLLWDPREEIGGFCNQPQPPQQVYSATLPHVLRFASRRIPS